jgi:hypothetical protein
MFIQVDTSQKSYTSNHASKLLLQWYQGLNEVLDEQDEEFMGAFDSEIYGDVGVCCIVPMYKKIHCFPAEGGSNFNFMLAEEFMYPGQVVRGMPVYTQMAIV